MIILYGVLLFDALLYIPLGLLHSTSVAFVSIWTPDGLELYGQCSKRNPFLLLHAGLLQQCNANVD